MSKISYCCICSAARSGSTFCDILLGGHSKTASLGEFSFLGKNIALNELCGCGVHVPQCPEWEKIFLRIKNEKLLDLRELPYALQQWDTLARKHVDPNQQTAHYLLLRKIRAIWLRIIFSLPGSSEEKFSLLPRTLRQGIENTLYLYSLVREEWNKQIVIDSSKQVYKTIALYAKCRDAMRVILLIRDGRGVYLSRRTTGRSRKQSLSGWKYYYQYALPLLKRYIHPSHLHVIKYEDLSTFPEQSAKELCDFLEIDYEESMVNIGGGTRHLINGNFSAKSTRVEKGIQIDEKWKKELTGNDLEYFVRHGELLNKKLGYV